jgi:hypothetical protein
MTAITPAPDQPFSVVLDDDQTTVAEGRWRNTDAGPTWAKHRVTIRLDETDADTRGHAYDPTSVAISLSFDDDAEGHALSLRFPSAEKADEFRKRLLATGALAAALIVGVTAAQITSTAPAASVTAPAAPAPVAGSAPRVTVRMPDEDLLPAAPPPAPHVTFRMPDEDLLPAAPPPAPHVTFRMPDEDLLPAADPGTSGQQR